MVTREICLSGRKHILAILIYLIERYEELQRVDEVGFTGPSQGILTATT
jgi:hypothetical protein